jgi:hypothetical protein
MPSVDDVPSGWLPDEEGLDKALLLINTLLGLHTVLHPSIYPHEDY